MDFISDFAQGFMALFQAGGETFVGWVTGIIPMVICLMTAINSIIKLIGEKRVENFTKKTDEIHNCALHTGTGAGSTISGKSDVLYLRTFRGRKVQACLL